MKPAIIIVDMLEGNYPKERTGREEEKIIEPVRDFLKGCRERSVPVIFACDSFLEGDFLFGGRMKPHSIRGSAGTRPLRDLEPQPGDMVLEKRRFSAFFRTDLDQTLRTLGVDTVAVGGINTHFCVLATAFDSVCNDFYTVILEDLSATYKRKLHETFMDTYRHNVLYPLLRVATSAAFMEEICKSA